MPGDYLMPLRAASKHPFPRISHPPPFPFKPFCVERACHHEHPPLSFHPCNTHLPSLPILCYRRRTLLPAAYEQMPIHIPSQQSPTHLLPPPNPARQQQMPLHSLSPNPPPPVDQSPTHPPNAPPLPVQPSGVVEGHCHEPSIGVDGYERQPVLAVHSIAGEVDAKAGLGQLGGHLLSWQVHRPAAIALAFGLGWGAVGWVGLGWRLCGCGGVVCALLTIRFSCWGGLCGGILESFWMRGQP